MNILITNDDGYQAKGIRVLAEIMCQFGSVTVIAPKFHQSGMSMAVSLGFRQIGYKKLPQLGPGDWSYLDATPASCVKFAVNLGLQPDVVLSGINHGHNAASASCYSGTLGAAAEAALNGFRAIGVSLDSLDADADFSAVRAHFPLLFERLMAVPIDRYGIYYNVNFPNLPANEIRGIRVGHQGMGKWIREFKEWNSDLYQKFGIDPDSFGFRGMGNAEAGETPYMMSGQFVDDPRNTERADHRLMQAGYISITPDHLDMTDEAEKERLLFQGFDTDF